MPTDVPWEAPVYQTPVFQASSSPAAPAVRDQGADAARDTWGTKTRTIEARGGFGGPLGYGGLSFEWAPVRWFATGAGAGYLPSGPQFGIMPRLRLPLTPWLAVGFGVPISLGPYIYDARFPQSTDVCSGPNCTYHVTRTWNMAVWGHLEPGVDVRFPNGLQARFYGGGSKVMNPHDATCASNFSYGCPSRAGEERLYGGVALGYAF